MDHNLSYRGPILVIQKLNIKFIDAATISMEDNSPIFLFVGSKISPQLNLYFYS